MLGRHTWYTMKIVQRNKLQETKTPLNKGRKITVINFHAINQVANALNYTEIAFLQMSEKDISTGNRTQEL